MKQKLWQLQKKKLWYSQLNITACFQAILDPITIVIRLSKIVFCKALMSFETSIDGSRKKGADIKSQMLWDISFLQIHHVHHLKFLRCWAVKTLVTSHLTPQPSNLLDYVMMLCVCVCWRVKMVVGTQTHFANFQRLLSWKYHMHYWKLLTYQYHITE